MKSKKCYAAGISDRNGDWVWQGTAVANNAAKALARLVEYKKKKNLVGKSLIAADISCDTNRKMGIYQTTWLS